jgi:hypothetical protein
VTNKNGKERNKGGFLGKEMVIEGATIIMKIDNPRGIATMERNPLIRFNKF